MRVVAIQVWLARRLLRVVEPAADLLVRGRWHVEPRQLAALQGHHHPSAHRGVCTHARSISPAAALRVLPRENEVDGPLRRFAERGVLRHAVRLANRDRGQAVAVTPHTLVRGIVERHKQIAVVSMTIAQIRETAPHDVLVLKPTLGVARPPKPQESPRRRPPIARQGRPPGKSLEAPPSLGPLMPRQKRQPPLDRFLRLWGLTPPPSRALLAPHASRPAA